MNTSNLVIRNDDVLQIGGASHHQRKAFKIKTPFEWFLEADEVFKEYQYPCTLAILSEGIKEYPEWVKYIIKNQHRYTIELHGSSHLWYNQMTAEEGYNDLERAIEDIENTFHVKVTTWYVPFGRKNIPDWGHKVCKELGIKMDVPTFKCLPNNYKQAGRKQINFHYWCQSQNSKIKRIIKELCKK